MFEKEQKEFFGYYDPNLDLETYKGKALLAYIEVDSYDMPRAIKRMTKRKMVKYYKKNKDGLKDIEHLKYGEYPEQPTQH
jgi:hypothetical protein